MIAFWWWSSWSIPNDNHKHHHYNDWIFFHFDFGSTKLDRRRRWSNQIKLILYISTDETNKNQNQKFIQTNIFVDGKSSCYESKTQRKDENRQRKWKMENNLLFDTLIVTATRKERFSCLPLCMGQMCVCLVCSFSSPRLNSFIHSFNEKKRLNKIFWI